jgi:predicted TIM-barrel fold metal-dependent hydrolase
MTIIDSQIHIWQANTPERPWPEGMVSLQGEPFSFEQALQTLDSAGVQRAILVPPSWVGVQNAYVLEAVRNAPDRFAVMGRFDPRQDDGPTRLRALRQEPGLLGLRMMLNTLDMVAMIDEPACAWFWETCESDGIPLMCFVPATPGALKPLAARYPKLRLIIDHAGLNPRGEKDDAAWLGIDALLGLSQHANIAVKVSSLPCFSSGPYPFTVLHKPIRALFDAFGSQRLLWGSDATRLTCPYGDNLKLFVEALDFLTADDREWILGKAAAAWCGWP